MALQSWWQIVSPHADIIKGELDESVFAADLGDVISGKAPQEYKDADLFFRKTYLTKGLHNLLEGVLGRLAGGKGSGVIQLQTPFGGGKTHALLALYHAVKNREGAGRLENVKILADALPADTKVACFVGTHADPLKGKTPWGSIAHQLGCYSIVKDHDKKRVAPGKEVLAEVFDASGPTLILIDELLEYVVKAAKAEEVEKTERGQVLAFLQELTEVVSTSPNLVLVLTLPSSVLEHYDEEAEKVLQQLQKISGRVEATFTPVEGMEIYEVIRTRLFEDLGDVVMHKEVASAYFDLYNKMGNDAPSEVKEVAYREKIEKAYPFHPELIDALYERWGSFPTFQRTRGVLRLLGLAVQDLFDKKDVSPVIHSSLLRLDNAKLRMEFIKHIGNEYDSVVAADVAGADAKSAKIDAEMGTEYARYDIAQGIATSVFLYSFSGAARKGITLPQLRVALVREGIPATIVGDAVRKLEEELWYFHTEGNLFSFTNQPNLNRVIIDREETVVDGIRDTLEAELRKMAGSEFDVKMWPRQPQDIPDGKKIRLAILSPDHLYPEGYTDEFVAGLFARSGEAYRAYRNVLLILALDSSQWQGLSDIIKRYLALDSIQKDENFKASLSPAGAKELEKKYKEVKEDVPHRIFNAYRHLAASSPKGARWLDMGIATMGAGISISFRVKDYLHDQEILLPAISARAILDKTFAKGEVEKPLQDIYDVFLKTPGMPMLEGFETLVGSVRSAVKSGTLGLTIGNDVFLKEEVATIPDDALVLTPEEAKKRKAVEEPAPGPGPEPGPAPGSELGPEPGPGPEPSPAIRRVTIKANIPSEHISSLIAGVINPLKAEGGILDVNVEIDATSEEGFSRPTLDTKVKETLHQISPDFSCEEG